MVDVAHAPVVAILTRAPSAGGKTRLFAGLAQPVDPALLEALLLDTIESSRVPGVVQVVAVDPPDATHEIRQLVPAHVQVMSQPDGSLGERMQIVLTELLGRGARAVVLIGSDLPDIDPAAVVEAFEALEARPDQIVLGPATDGGYYLIGAARVPGVFDGIPWGGGAVLSETLVAARRRGVPVRLLTAAGDVDTPADLHRLLRARTTRAARTTAWARRRIGDTTGGTDG
jgi:rSAM/selenodomain-associated transferase 1